MNDNIYFEIVFSFACCTDIYFPKLSKYLVCNISSLKIVNNIITSLEFSKYPFHFVEVSKLRFEDFCEDFEKCK